MFAAFAGGLGQSFVQGAHFFVQVVQLFADLYVVLLKSFYLFHEIIQLVFHEAAELVQHFFLFAAFSAEYFAKEMK